MESNSCSGTLRSGEWRAERASGELSGPAGILRLEPKVMDLLFLLASRAGEVTSREAIMAALWPGLVVGDDSLARSVSKLRQALGDDARAPRYVETIAKRGYRWCAPVQWEARSAGEAGAAPGTGAAPLHAVPRGPSRAWHRSAAVALVAGAVLIAAWAWRGASRPDDGSAAGAAVGTTDTRERDALLARADDAYFQFSRADNEAAIELYQRVLGVYPDDPAAMAGLANALVQRALRWPQA